MIKKETISNRLNLLDFFKDMNNYVIIRLDENFPSYKYSDDVDILCSKPIEIIEHIKKIGNKLYNDFNITVNNGSGGKSHFHVNFYYKNENIEDFCFDIISNLSDFYKKIDLPKDYIDKVLKTKKINKLGLYIPDLSNELELRYMEYITKIDRKPDKIKHLKFIEKYPNIEFKKYKFI